MIHCAWVGATLAVALTHMKMRQVKPEQALLVPHQEGTLSSTRCEVSLYPVPRVLFSRYSLSANVIPRANKHTSTGHALDHRGRCGRMLSRTYDIDIGK